MVESAQQAERPSLGSMAVLGGLVVTGWSLQDLGIFVTSGQPSLAGTLLVPTAILILAGVLAGGILGALNQRVPTWILVLGAALALGLSLRIDLGLDERRLILLRSLGLLELTMLAAVELTRRCSIGHLRAGLSLGLLACAAMGLWQIQMGVWELVPKPRSFILPSAALLLLLLGWVRSSRMRYLGSALVLLLAVAGTAAWALEADRLRHPGEAAPGVPVQGPGRDLLLVVLDTVRADHLAPYGYERQTTPLLDEFVAQRAERYQWARSTSSWTLPSHASLFTGLLPSEHGATHPRGEKNDATVAGAAAQAQSLREDAPTLAEILGARGYRTGAVIANHYYLGERYGLSRGYQHYDARPGGDVRHYLPLAQMAWVPLRAGRQSYRDASSVTERALDWLQADPGERPQFLTLNYMDAHSPYFPAPPHDEAFGGGRVEEPTKFHQSDRIIQYDRGLHYIDTQLMRVLGAMDLDKTVVIITSDHGEGLGDHGYWMHGWTLYDSLTRVPLYVQPVGRERVPVREEPISGAEIFDLALTELGLELPLERQALRPAGEWFQPLRIPNSKVLADKDVRRDLVIWTEGSLKWTVTSRGDVSVVDVVQDPKELSPLELDAEQIAQAQARAKAWWAANPPLERQATQVESEDLDHLKDLGYLGEDEGEDP